MISPAAKVKFFHFVRKLSEVTESTPYGARSLVRAVLHMWKKEAFPSFAQKTPYGTAELLRNTHVQGFAEWLTLQPFSEAAYWLSSAYAIWVGDEARTHQALFFTPPILANRVIDNLVAQGASLSDQRWHDPACGGSAFLVPIATRMSLELTQRGLRPIEMLTRIEDQISGTDLNSTLLEISIQFLQMALYKYILASGYTPTFNLKIGDGLLVGKAGNPKIDVIACNPPFRKLSAIETKKYSSCFGDVIRNQPNIYGLFIKKTIDLVNPGGLIGLLTPTSFLSGSSFSKLRMSIVKCSNPIQIDLLSKRSSIFLDVEQDVVITTLKSKTCVSVNASELMDDLISDIFVLGMEGDFRSVGRCKLSATGLPWPIPRSESDADLLLESQVRASRLCDYGYIPKVGHLVAYRDMRRRFAKRPKHRNSSCIVPIIWAGDITLNGFEHGREHKLNREDYFVEVTHPLHVSVIKEPSVVLQRVTSSDQVRRLVACAVPRDWQLLEGGFVAENHVIALVAQKNCKWSPELIADLINSDVINRLFRARSGATNVAVGEINDLPLPDPVLLALAMKDNSDMNVAVRVAFGF